MQRHWIGVTPMESDPRCPPAPRRSRLSACARPRATPAPGASSTPARPGATRPSPRSSPSVRCSASTRRSWPSARRLRPDDARAGATSATTRSLTTRPDEQPGAMPEIAPSRDYGRSVDCRSTSARRSSRRGGPTRRSGRSCTTSSASRRTSAGPAVRDPAAPGRTARTRPGSGPAREGLGRRRASAAPGRLHDPRHLARPGGVEAAPRRDPAARPPGPGRHARRAPRQARVLGTARGREVSFVTRAGRTHVLRIATR